MKLSDFDFSLPEDRIALRPVSPRHMSRLYVCDGQVRHHARFADLATYLRPGDHLVFNDTKVIPARLFGQRRRGEAVAKVEITLSQPVGSSTWEALAKPSRKLAPGDVIQFGPLLAATVVDMLGEGRVILDLAAEGLDVMEALSRTGVMPLPPYIASRRPADAADMDDYQTVFARETGAIAAPTASLHFDEVVLKALRARDIGHSFVTLHVGLGTFLPVKVDNIAEHRMHAEEGAVSEDSAAAINQARAAGGRIIPVGTTALRLIETATDDAGRISAWRGDTDIFIAPGYVFRMADGLITNFHLPQSTLMMLVSALMGRERIMDIYQDAIARDYRFFSYGDGSLLIP